MDAGKEGQVGARGVFTPGGHVGAWGAENSLLSERPLTPGQVPACSSWANKGRTERGFWKETVSTTTGPRSQEVPAGPGVGEGC